MIDSIARINRIQKYLPLAFSDVQWQVSCSAIKSNISFLQEQLDLGNISLQVPWEKNDEPAQKITRLMKQRLTGYLTIIDDYQIRVSNLIAEINLLTDSEIDQQIVFDKLVDKRNKLLDNLEVVIDYSLMVKEVTKIVNDLVVAYKK